MRDSDHGAIFKVVVDRLKDDFFSNIVDTGSSFINENDFTLAQNSSSNAQELLFTCTQVFSSFFDLF